LLTSQIIRLSTRHITGDASLWLSFQANTNSVVYTPSGWCVFVADLDDMPGIPASMQTIVTWCRTNGIQYVLFDVGADIIDELPVYEEGSDEDLE
jgi:hypothetical protein